MLPSNSRFSALRPSRYRALIVPNRPRLLLFGGVLMALAHPPFHLIVPSFVALVPLIVWLEGLESGPAGRRQARIGGFFFGLVYYSLVLYWLVIALSFYTWLALLAFLAPVMILCVILSWAAVGYHLVRRRLKWPVAVAFPLFWTANEWVRAHLHDIRFPWMQLGDTLSGFPVLVGAADLGGSRGLSLWLAAANAIVATGVITWRRKGWRPVGPQVALLMVVLAGPLGYSLYRWNTLETRPAASVGIVQPNVPQHLKNDDPLAATDSALRAVETLTETWTDDVALDLVVFPETMFQGALVDALPSFGYRGWPDAVTWGWETASRLGADVVVGGLGANDLGDRKYQPFNSAFHYRVPAASNTVGENFERYDKRYLVPLVERVPFIPPRWLAGLPYMDGNFGVGEWKEPVRIGTADVGADVEISYGTMICYESIFSPLARHYRRNGADFLVNITNDSWFGRDAWWSRTSALWQHPAHLVMRVIETRIGAVRSANTGISMIVDPLGRVSQRTQLFEPDAFRGVVETTDGHTLYVRTGDVVGTLSAILAGLALTVIGVRSWRARAQDDGSSTP